MVGTDGDNTGFVLRALLAPVVGYCLRRGVRFRVCEQYLKEAFVHAARNEIQGLSSAEASANRVSVATGIHRSEVSRIMSGRTEGEERHDVLRKVVGLWSGSTRFQNADGTPRRLSFEGAGSDFADLVQRVSKDVSPYPLLFELERLNAIVYHGDRIELVTREYIPEGDVRHAFETVGADIHDLILAAEENLHGGDQPASLHLRTMYDNVAENALPELLRWLITRGRVMHEEARALFSRFDRDVNEELPGEGGRCTVSFTTVGRAHVARQTRSIDPKKRGRRKGKR